MLGRLTDQVEKEQRDLQVLEAVIESGPIGIVRIAEQTDVPEHKVRYSLRMLEDDELVEPTPNGAIPADDVAERLGTINDGLDDLSGRLDALRETV
jgi:predicted transcriptional regulator